MCGQGLQVAGLTALRGTFRAAFRILPTCWSRRVVPTPWQSFDRGCRFSRRRPQGWGRLVSISKPQDPKLVRANLPHSPGKCPGAKLPGAFDDLISRSTVSPSNFRAAWYAGLLQALAI